MFIIITTWEIGLTKGKKLNQSPNQPTVFNLSGTKLLKNKVPKIVYI